MVPRWPSLKALIRDLGALQNQNHTLGERLRESNSQVNTAQAMLAQAQDELYRARQELQQRDDRREACNIAQKSLEYEFKKGNEADRELEHSKRINRSLIALIDQLRVTPDHSSNRFDLPLNRGIGSLLQQSEDMKRTIAVQAGQLRDGKAAFDRLDNNCRMMMESRGATVNSLEERDNEIMSLKAELYQLYESLHNDSGETGIEEDSGSEDGKETVTSEKRKREDQQ